MEGAWRCVARVARLDLKDCEVPPVPVAPDRVDGDRREAALEAIGAPVPADLFVLREGGDAGLRLDPRVWRQGNRRGNAG